MDLEIGSDVQQLTPKGILSFIILPILTNLSILLFEIGSLDAFTASSDPTNVLGLIGIFFYYIGCLLLFVAYGRSTGGWDVLFGAKVRVLAGFLVVTYPVFYLFWLPIIIYQLLLYVGTPRSIWEKGFEGTMMSTEWLHPDFCFSRCQRILRFIYIGIPFGIFSLIIIAIIIVLSPLWYFILSPLGFGTLGICLHISLHFPHSTETDLLERIALTYRWGVFVHVWALALPFTIISISHLVVVGVTWFGVMLAIFSLLQFLIDAIPSVMDVLRNPEK
jgi:hypothetical protein